MISININDIFINIGTPKPYLRLNSLAAGSFSFLLQQLGEEDKLRVDKIQATPVIQPLPDSVNSMWEKISQRAALNKESDITWDQIVESTSGTPPLSKDEFLSYTAGEPTLSSAGLIKLKEKQAVKTR